MANPVPADSRGLGLLLAFGVVLVLSLSGFALLKSGAAVVVTDSRVVTVVHANEEGHLLQAAFYQATRRGVGTQFAAEVMRRLNDYVDRRTGNGQTATLCVDMAVDVLAAAHHAKWSAADSSRIVLHLQAELDADGPAAALAHSRRVTALIGLGNTADQILDGQWRAPAGDCWGETGYSSSRIEPGSIRARVATEDARRKVAHERTGGPSRAPAGTPRPCG
jgi:hypothetical protein